MRVLMLPSFYDTLALPINGTFFREQALALSTIGLRVEVLFLEPLGLRNLSLNNVRRNHFQVTVENSRVTTVRQHGWNTFGQFSIGAAVWLALSYRLASQWLSRTGLPDVLHAQNSLWAGILARKLSKRFGVRYVLTEHSSAFLTNRLSRLERGVARRALTGARRVLTVSRALAQCLERYYPDHPITVIPNTVNTDFFTLPPVNRDRHRFIFACIGRLDSNKAFDIAIRAFAKAFARDDDSVRLLIAGTGVEKRDLQRIVDELDLHRSVSLVGELDRSGVRKLLWESNALVCSSYKETFGVVLIEAMATGIPVIATRSGGPDEIVGKDVGVLVKTGDIEGLAESMRQVRHSVNYPCDALRNHVVNRYGYASVARKLDCIYRESVRCMNDESYSRAQRECMP